MRFERIDELKRKLDAVRPLPPAVAARLREHCLVEWTHHSTALEGPAPGRHSETWRTLPPRGALPSLPGKTWSSHAPYHGSDTGDIRMIYVGLDALTKRSTPYLEPDRDTASGRATPNVRGCAVTGGRKREGREENIPNKYYEYSGPVRDRFSGVGQVFVTPRNGGGCREV